MSTFNIQITDTDGKVDKLLFTVDDAQKKYTVKRESEPNDTMSFDDGENLMQILNGLAFDVPGACGGMAACGTCHLSIESGNVPNPLDTDEEFMLDGLPNSTDKSRLACQIPVVPGLADLEAIVLGDL